MSGYVLPDKLLVSFLPIIHIYLKAAMRHLSLLLVYILLNPCQIMAQGRTLDYYINQGLKNSPLLKDYQLQIASNSVDSQKVKATFKPQVGLNGQIYYAPNYNGYGYDGQVTNGGGNYQAQLAVSQALIIHKSKQAQLEGLDIQNQSLANTSKISELDLRRAITDQYIIAYRDFGIMQSVHEVLDLLSGEEDAIRPLVQRGIYAQTDFLNIRMAGETQRLSLRQSQIQYQNDLYSLNIICGLEDTAFASLSRPVIDVAQQPDLANSVLLRQYRIDSFKFMNRRKLVDVNYQPKLSAFADAGIWSTYIPAIYRNLGAGVGLNFSMPLYDGKQRKFEYQKIALAAQISHNYELFYKRQYKQQVMQLSAQLRATDDLIAETNKQIALAREVIDAYRAQLDRGLIRVTDLVLTVNNYINFKTSASQASMSRLQIINQLNYYK
jgi:outer membrane protein TolC